MAKFFILQLVLPSIAKPAGNPRSAIVIERHAAKLAGEAAMKIGASDSLRMWSVWVQQAHPKRLIVSVTP
jgi:hypothetical protein